MKAIDSAHDNLGAKKKPICTRCNKESGLLGALSFNKQMGRCGKCEQELKQVLVNFRGTFLNAFSSGLINDAQWEGLINYVAAYRINASEALTFIRGDGLHFIERSLTYFLRRRRD
jgi:hypothetical protein